MSIPKLIAKFETVLASGISTTATTATLSSALTKNGTTIPTATYGFVIDEGTASEEYIIADVSGTAMTNMVRGLSYEDTTSSVTALKKAHRQGANVKITDHPALLHVIEVIKGEQPFDGIIKNPAVRTISDNRHVIDKEYFDEHIPLGGADASTTTKGSTKISVAPAAPDNPIAVGTNDPRVPTQDENDALVGTLNLPSAANKYVTNDDTGWSGALKVLRLNASGLVPPAVLSTGDNQSTAAKSINTVYQNTSARSKLVTFVVFFSRGIGGQAAETSAFIGPTSSPDTLVSYTGYLNESGYSQVLAVPLTFIVPPSYYFKVAGNTTVSTYFECDLV